MIIEFPIVYHHRRGFGRLVFKIGHRDWEVQFKPIQDTSEQVPKPDEGWALESMARNKESFIYEDLVHRRSREAFVMEDVVHKVVRPALIPIRWLPKTEGRAS